MCMIHRERIIMKLCSEVSLQDFNTWAGANSTKDALTWRELDELEEHLEELYPNGLDETELNDILWFECDWIAEMLGYVDWEDLEAHEEERYEQI